MDFFFSDPDIFILTVLCNMIRLDKNVFDFLVSIYGNDVQHYVHYVIFDQKIISLINFLRSWRSFIAF